MLGPIDYIVVGFKGNNFDGSILEELTKAVESGAVRVVDLLFVIKDSNGDAAMAELQDQDDELRQLARTLGVSDDLPLVTEEDVDKVAAKMDNDTSAGVLVIEHLWAKGLTKALLDKGAILIDEGRIHPNLINEAVEELKAAK